MDEITLKLNPSQFQIVMLALSKAPIPREVTNMVVPYLEGQIASLSKIEKKVGKPVDSKRAGK